MAYFPNSQALPYNTPILNGSSMSHLNILSLSLFLTIFYTNLALGLDFCYTPLGML